MRAALGAALLLLALAGCVKEPIATATVGNDVVVEKLFTHEGVTVYRFMDSWRYHYYAVRGDRIDTFASWSESCGKNCTRQHAEEVTTLEARR